MKTLPLLALALCAVPCRADLSYDLRVTTIAHPSLGMKSKEVIVHTMIQGSRQAIRFSDMVQVADPDLNLVTLIDYRTRTFATSNLDELLRGDDKGFDAIQSDIRSELIQNAQPAVWNGLAVKRDVSRTVLTGGLVSGVVLATSDWIEQIPDVPESHLVDSADARHTQEVEAELQALVFRHPERFSDNLKIHKAVSGRMSFQIHSLTEMRLAPDSPLLKTLGPEYVRKPLMSQETELLHMSAAPVDPAIFQVPPGFQQVEFMDLLKQKYIRAHY